MQEKSTQGRGKAPPLRKMRGMVQETSVRSGQSTWRQPSACSYHSSVWCHRCCLASRSLLLPLHLHLHQMDHGYHHWLPWIHRRGGPARSSEKGERGGVKRRMHITALLATPGIIHEALAKQYPCAITKGRRKQGRSLRPLHHSLNSGTRVVRE